MGVGTFRQVRKVLTLSHMEEEEEAEEEEEEEE